MLATQPNPIFSVAEIGILNCSGCGKPMRLACIEPDKPGFDLRTFECAKCNTGETFLVAIWAGFMSRLIVPPAEELMALE